MSNDTPALDIAHIQDGEFVFQVLNADGTDWDEAATRAAYVEWLAAQIGGGD